MLMMSPFQLKCCILISLAAMLAVFELATRLSDRHRIKTGQAEDLRENDTALVKHNAVQHSKLRFWTEGVLVIATGAMLVVSMLSLMDYQDHGAFYDESWRDPGVESHFYFDASDNRKLESIYKSDPDAFPWSEYRIVLVKLGCEDCERVHETIEQLAASGYSVVFSTSELGKACVERYGITYVPSAVMDGLTVQLRSGDSILPGTGNGEGVPDYGSQAQDIVDDLLGGLATDDEGNDPAASDPNYTRYGTKAAQEYEEEQARLREEGSGDQAGGSQD